jgi:hypothetical protein
MEIKRSFAMSFGPGQLDGSGHDKVDVYACTLLPTCQTYNFCALFNFSMSELHGGATYVYLMPRLYGQHDAPNMWPGKIGI